MSQGTPGASRGSGAPDQSAYRQHAQARHPQSSGLEQPQRSQTLQVPPSSSTAPPGLLNPGIDPRSAATSPASLYSTPLQSPQPPPEHLLSTPTQYSPTPRHPQPPSPNDHVGLGHRIGVGENPAARSQDRSNLSRFPVHGREDVGVGAHHPAPPTVVVMPSDPRPHQGREGERPHPSRKTSGPGSNMDYSQYASGSSSSPGYPPVTSPTLNPAHIPSSPPSSSLPSPGYHSVISPTHNPAHIPSSPPSSSLPSPGYHSVTSPTHNPAHVPSSPPSFTSAMVGHSADLQNRGNIAWTSGNNENFTPTLDQRVAQLPSILEGVSLQSTSITGDAKHVQPPFHHNLIELLKTLREEGRKTADQGAIRHLVNLLSNDYEKVPGLLHDNNDIRNLMEFLLYQLDNNSLSNTGFEEGNHRARRLLIKLGMDKVTIPDTLRIDPRKITISRDAFDCGGYGDVYSGRYRGEHVALKRIRSPINDKDLCREVLAWRTVSHKCLLRFIGVYIDSSQRVHLVSPLMKGTLSDWRKLVRITVSDIQNHMLSAAEGLRYLHWKGVIHGDIRGSNILLDHHHQAKIADFGLARHSDGTGTNNETMSAPFTAPELFCGTGELKRTTKTDVYAFGCLFYEIHFGVLPFVGGVYNIGQTVRRGQRPRRLKEPLLHDEAWKLMQCCWDMEPTKRPSVDDVVQNVNFWCHPPVLT